MITTTIVTNGLTRKHDTEVGEERDVGNSFEGFEPADGHQDQCSEGNVEVFPLAELELALSADHLVDLVAHEEQVGDAETQLGDEDAGVDEGLAPGPEDSEAELGVGLDVRAVLLLDLYLQHHRVDVDHPAERDPDPAPEVPHLLESRRSCEDADADEALDDVEVGPGVADVAAPAHLLLDDRVALHLRVEDVGLGLVQQVGPQVEFDGLPRLPPHRPGQALSVVVLEDVVLRLLKTLLRPHVPHRLEVLGRRL